VAVNQRTLSPWARRPDVRIGAVVALVALVAFLVWLLVIRDSGSGSGSASQPSATPLAPVAASPGRIRDLSVEVGRPIYWLGPEKGKVYELQRTSQDRIYVRYLPPSASIGTTKAAYPLVGTYPVPNAYGVLKSLAKTSGETSFAAPRGAIAVYSNSRPTNIYLAYPGSDEQIEVYDPVPGNARTLVDAGRVVPVGS
jgi:hypothetical protein